MLSGHWLYEANAFFVVLKIIQCGINVFTEF